jgi:hypothetical protein
VNVPVAWLIGVAVNLIVATIVDVDASIRDVLSAVALPTGRLQAERINAPIATK